MEPTEKPALKQSEPILLRLERAGRGGKTVTVLDGFRLHPAGKEDLLSRLKKRCGAGGALKAGKLEIQGDQRPALARELERLGYRVKMAN
jgi:translation initiation factor 1